MKLYCPLHDVTTQVDGNVRRHTLSARRGSGATRCALLLVQDLRPGRLEVKGESGETLITCDVEEAG